MGRINIRDGDHFTNVGAKTGVIILHIVVNSTPQIAQLCMIHLERARERA